MKRKTSSWKFLGTVGVDSGQLMVIDPCYLEELTKIHDKHYEVKFWGQGEKKAMKHFKLKTTRKKFDNLNDANIFMNWIKDYSQEINEIICVSVEDGNYYDKCSRLTCDTKEQGGAIPFPNNPMYGLATVFSSGLGDGVYNVEAKYKNVGDITMHEEDWRIAEVRIKLL